MSNITKDEMEFQEAVVQVRKTKRKKKIILTVIAATVVLAILAGVFSYGYKVSDNNSQKEITEAQAETDYWKKKYDEIRKKPVVLDPVTPEVVQKVLSENMTDISELATAEYMFTNAARFTDTAHIIKMFDWMTKKSFVQQWDGKIKAGVKLDKVEVSVKDKVITITMPHAEILSYEIDYNSVKVLDEKNNVFNPITVDDKVNFDRETKYDMEARAVKNGLLKKAETNAKKSLSNIFAASIPNIQDYEIKFKVVDK